MIAWRAELIAAKTKQAMPILSFLLREPDGHHRGGAVRRCRPSGKGMKLVADRVPACASVSMMDLSVEAEAFGAKAHFMPVRCPR